jgi:hypothetical protein
MLPHNPVNHAARLASQLFLLPENVLYLCTYWLSQYSNYTLVKNEKECFNEMVSGLLRRPPRLYLCANQGPTQHLYNTLRCQGIIQFAGTERHRMPLEYLARGYMTFLIDSLSQVMRPEAGCFLTRNTDGLDGELELSSFVHDSVMEAVAEPSFLVITAYFLHLHALYHTTCSEVAGDWVPRHVYSLRAINEEGRASIRCGDVEKLGRTRADLERLHDILNTTDFDNASREVTVLWEEKATYCYSQIMVRCDKLNVATSSSPITM